MQSAAKFFLAPLTLLVALQLKLTEGAAAVGGTSHQVPGQCDPSKLQCEHANTTNNTALFDSGCYITYDAYTNKDIIQDCAHVCGTDKPTYKYYECRGFDNCRCKTISFIFYIIITLLWYVPSFADYVYNDATISCIVNAFFFAEFRFFFRLEYYFDYELKFDDVM